MLIRASRSPSRAIQSGHPLGKDRAGESNPDAEDVIGGFPERVAFERRRPEVRAEKRVGEPKGGRQPVVHEDGLLGWFQNAASRASGRASGRIRSGFALEFLIDRIL